MRTDEQKLELEDNFVTDWDNTADINLVNASVDNILKLEDLIKYM